jgi:hypothetical protein
MAFCFINIPYQVGALFTVAVGFQAAEDWPPLFGDLSDAYLVSRAWGRTWHQLMRRPLGMLTPYIQTWLKATSRARKRTISLFSSFAMSGFSPCGYLGITHIHSDVLQKTFRSKRTMPPNFPFALNEAELFSNHS